MIEANYVIEDLKNKGHRLTRARKAILNVFSSMETSLSADELKKYLEKASIKVDKTTIYREIAFLKEQKIIHEIQFREGKMRYKMCPLDDRDHHHMICLNCDKVESIEPIKYLEDYQKKIGTKKKFKIMFHSLEIFGLCASCS